MKVLNEKSPTRYCDSFFIKSYLANHITAVYEEMEPFQCKICDYKCAQKSTLNKLISEDLDEKKPSFFTIFVFFLCYF